MLPEPKIKIGNRIIIKEDNTPYLIAEIGVNYYDIAKKENIDLLTAARLMIKEAANAGVDAVKFQTYKASSLASKNSPAYWDTRKEPTQSQYELFKKYDKLDYDDYGQLAEYANSLNVDFFSTPFDEEAVDVLDKFVPAFKVASADITNKPLIKKIAHKQKPVILSTGAATISEIWEAVSWILEEGNDQISILHCVLSYPTDPGDANLGAIRELNRIFKWFVVGYSDHVPPDPEMEVLTTAFLLGASIIEKHFTLDKTIPGNDHYHAMDPEDIKKFRERIKKLKMIIGYGVKKPLEVEQNSRKYARRSIVAKRKIKKGEIITEDKITVKRPGTGISPVFWGEVIGKKASRDIEEDEILQWNMLE